LADLSIGAEDAGAACDALTCLADLSIRALFVFAEVIKALSVDAELSIGAGGIGIADGDDTLPADAKGVIWAIFVVATGRWEDTLSKAAALKGIGAGDEGADVIDAGACKSGVADAAMFTGIGAGASVNAASSVDAGFASGAGDALAGVCFASAIDADLASGTGNGRTGQDALSIGGAAKFACRTGGIGAGIGFTDGICAKLALWAGRGDRRSVAA
jgi:hypothetical protein